jgi:hypothetical protein
MRWLPSLLASLRLHRSSFPPFWLSLGIISRNSCSYGRSRVYLGGSVQMRFGVSYGL